MVLLWTACAVAVFAFCTHRLEQARIRNALIEQARVCAAAIQPGPNGDLSQSVDQLQTRYPRLLAVATLDSFDQLQDIYPDRPAHRQTVLAVHQSRSGFVDMRTPDDSGSTMAAGVVLPLNGSTSATARHTLILLKADADGQTLQATAIFTMLIGGSAIIGVSSLRRWFERRIAMPLRRMADALRDAPEESKDFLPAASGGWHETVEIAGRFHDLLHALAQNDAEVKQVMNETERRIRHDQREFNRELRRERDRAFTDALTRLRNRTFLDEEFDSLFKNQCALEGDLAAVMIDVDNFKPYNDAHGHPVGDAVLRFVGALLYGAIRPTDYAVRYGGDEFLLLLPDTDAVQACAVADRLVKLFRQYARRLAPGHGLSLSAGVASLQADRPDTGHALIVKADAALYAAKRRGKNAVTIHQVA